MSFFFFFKLLSVWNLSVWNLNVLTMRLRIVNLSRKWLLGNTDQGRQSQSTALFRSAWNPYHTSTWAMWVKLVRRTCSKAVNDDLNLCASTSIKVQVIMTEDVSVLSLSNYWLCQIMRSLPETARRIYLA